MRYISNNALTRKGKGEEREKKKEKKKKQKKMIDFNDQSSLIYSNVYSPVFSNRDWGLLVTVTRLPFKNISLINNINKRKGL